MVKAYVQITIETEERADRWACRSPELGFIVYGVTREAARGEVNKAVTALLASFHGDIEAIERFLTKRGVPYYRIEREQRDEPDAVTQTSPENRRADIPSHGGTEAETSLEEVLIA